MWHKVSDWLLVSLAAIWALVAPIHGLMYALGLLVLADMAMGVWRAIKHSQQVRPSQAIRMTIGKAAVYLIAVLAGFTLDYLLNDSAQLVARGFAVAIGLAECSSIAENFLKITGIDLVQVIKDRFKPPPSDKG